MNLDEVTPSEVSFVPGPYETETVEAWHEITIYAPWSDEVTAETATFADHRGAVIAKLNYTEHGVPTRQQAQANARLLKAAPSLYTFLQKIYLDYEGDCGCECNTDTCCAVVGEPCAKCHAFIALALVDVPQTKETK